MSLKGIAMTDKVLRGKITNIHQIEDVEALYAEAEKLIAREEEVKESAQQAAESAKKSAESAQQAAESAKKLVSDIEAELDNIITIQNTLIGGDSV